MRVYTVKAGNFSRERGSRSRLHRQARGLIVAVLPVFALTFGCNRTSSNLINDHYREQIPKIVRGNDGKTVIAYTVREWHKETHNATQITLFKQDELHIDTTDDGHLKLNSVTTQTEKQVEGSTSPFRHLFWSIMLSGTLNTLNEVLGKTFETMSNNKTAVDLKRIDTDGDVAIEGLMQD